MMMVAFTVGLVAVSMWLMLDDSTLDCEVFLSKSSLLRFWLLYADFLAKYLTCTNDL